MKTTKLSLNEAARAFGVSKDTILRRCREAGIATGKTYTIRDVHRALAGDLKFERARETRARADMVERENAREIGESVEWGTVALYLSQRVIAPIQNALDACKDTEWVEGTLKPALEQANRISEAKTYPGKS